jgi:hypothetical protein
MLPSLKSKKCLALLIFAECSLALGIRIVMDKLKQDALLRYMFSCL